MSVQTSAIPAQRQQVTGPQQQRRFRPGRAGLALLGMVAIVWLLANLFLAFGYYPQWFGSKIVIAIVALIAGVGGAAVLFTFLNMFVEALPQRMSLAVIPYAFLLPGLALVALVLLYPALQTINYSFANSDSTAYIGLQNYQTIFTDSEFWASILNNILWLLVVPAVTVAIGVAVAVLADKLSATGEKTAKSLIFLPMAISFVGATAIWGLIYAYNNPGSPQTGVLNAIWTSFGGQPQTWLTIETAKLNSLLLMVILIWLQAGSP
jgi:alpha-glucoside transport system permease protein